MGKLKIEDLYEKAIELWRINKGKGCIYIEKPLNNYSLILGVFQRILNKTPTSKILVVVNNFDERTNLISFITHTDNDNNNEEIKELLNKKQIKVYTEDFMYKWNYRETFNLVITLGINKYNFVLEKVSKLSNFILVCLTNCNITNEEKLRLESKIPIVYTFDENNNFLHNINSPVKEIRYEIELSNENYKELQKCNDYIQETINIFGSLDIIEQCRNGNPQLNISAASIRQNIAESNGWNKFLDTKNEFNKKIDDMYNPENLLERSSTIYKIIHKRSNLLANSKEKLDTILNICLKHNKVLIISKTTEFASIITKYLNDNISNINKHKSFICANYHKDVEKIEAIDLNNGEPILIKSGINKGKPKMRGAESQMKLYMALFNNNDINILSCGNSPNKALECNVDAIIITSSQCDSIKEIKYRLNKVRFNSIPNLIYKLYIKGSIEEKLLNKEPKNDFHYIVNKNKNDEEIDNISSYFIAD